MCQLEDDFPGTILTNSIKQKENARKPLSHTPILSRLVPLIRRTSI